MTFKGILTAIAATALVASPTMAAAAPVHVAQPATEEVNGDNALRGGGWVVGLLALAAIIAGIIIIADNDDKPNSP